MTVVWTSISRDAVSLITSLRGAGGGGRGQLTLGWILHFTFMRRIALYSIVPVVAHLILE